MTVFNIVLTKTSIMVALLAVGYLFGRKKLVSENARRDIAIIVSRFLLPVYIFQAMSQNINPDNLVSNIAYLGWGTLFIAIAMVTAWLISRIVPGSKLNKLMCYYVLSFPNIAYFGYPVTEAAFGTEAMVQFIIFSLPCNLVLNTYGIYVLTSQRNSEDAKFHLNFSILKSLPFELLIGICLGIGAGLLQIPFPKIVTDFLTFTSNGMSPMAMLLAGLILASQPLSKLFRSGRAYIISVIKIFLMPILLGGAAYLCGMRGFELIYLVTLNCLPVGMNVVIFARPEQPDYTDTTVVYFISYIFGLVGVPLMVALVSIIA